MVNVRTAFHIDEADYLDLPRYGVHARRDTRSATLPASHIPFNPTHTVRMTFGTFTFRTNVKAVDDEEAERKAMVNLRYTFWPESRMRDIGPILGVEVTRA